MHGLSWNRLPLLIGIFTALYGKPAPVRADVGPPPPPDDIRVKVTFHGKALPESVFRAVALSSGPISSGPGKRNRGQHDVPGLTERALKEPDGQTWLPIRSAEGKDGQVTLTRSDRWDSLPDRIRLAIYLPESGRLFVTDALSIRPYLNYLHADVHADGTGTLGHSPGLLAFLDLYFVRKSPQMGWALGLTLLLELPLVLVWSFVARLSFKRMLWAGLIGNLISLPLVWFVTVGCEFEFGLSWTSLTFFGLAEAAAVLFEGSLYIRLGGAPKIPAYIFSFGANALTMCTGVLLIY